MANADQDSLELAKVILQVVGYCVSWVLIIGGWVYNSKDNIERERRKELRNQIDALSEQIEEIEKEALSYFQTVDDTSEFKSLGITGSMGRVSRHLTRLKKTSGLSAVGETIRFRQAITGGDFASSARQPVGATDPLLQIISQSALDLIDRLETEFSRLHP